MALSESEAPAGERVPPGLDYLREKYAQSVWGDGDQVVGSEERAKRVDGWVVVEWRDRWDEWHQVASFPAL